MDSVSDTLIVSKYGVHRRSCPWSRDDAEEGPDTCACQMERRKASRWVRKHLSPNACLSQFGLHLDTCSLLDDRGGFCLCYADLMDAVRRAVSAAAEAQRPAAANVAAAERSLAQQMALRVAQDESNNNLYILRRAWLKERYNM